MGGGVLSLSFTDMHFLCKNSTLYTEANTIGQMVLIKCMIGVYNLHIIGKLL